MTGQGHALNPDGRTFARQAITTDGIAGAIEILDASDGRVETTLEGFCSWDEVQATKDWGSPRQLYGDSECRAFPEAPFAMSIQSIRWSPDGRWVSASDAPPSPRGRRSAAAWWGRSTQAQQRVGP